MSDKLQEDFDLYYAELKNFTGSFEDNSHGIETDKLLSRAGKNEQGEKIKVSHLKSVNDLDKRFHTDFDKRLVNIDDRVNGVKHDLVLDAIKKKFSKGENLSSEETSRLLLSETRENQRLMKKSNFQNMMSNSDIEQVRKTAQALADSKDVEKLIWLQEMVSFRGDTALANTIQGQADGIRTSQLTDEQRNLQTVSERIQKGMKLFQYSLERSKLGDFVDARQDEIIGD